MNKNVKEVISGLRNYREDSTTLKKVALYCLSVKFEEDNDEAGLIRAIKHEKEIALMGDQVFFNHHIKRRRDDILLKDTLTEADSAFSLGSLFVLYHYAVSRVEEIDELTDVIDAAIDCIIAGEVTAESILSTPKLFSKTALESAIEFSEWFELFAEDITEKMTEDEVNEFFK